MKNIDRVVDRASKESLAFLGRFLPMSSTALAHALRHGVPTAIDDVDALALSVTLLVLSLRKMEETGIYPKGGLEELQKIVASLFESMWAELVKSKEGGR